MNVCEASDRKPICLERRRPIPPQSTGTVRFLPTRTTTPQVGHPDPTFPDLFPCRRSHHGQERTRRLPQLGVSSTLSVPPICELYSRPNMMRTSAHCAGSTLQSLHFHYRALEVSRAAWPCLDARCTHSRLQPDVISIDRDVSSSTGKDVPSLPPTTKFSSTPPKQLRNTCRCCL